MNMKQKPLQVTNEYDFIDFFKAEENFNPFFLKIKDFGKTWDDM